MNRVTVSTPITLKNGKVAIIEEDKCEFVPEIWDIIKSYMISGETYHIKWVKGAIIKRNAGLYLSGSYTNTLFNKLSNEGFVPSYRLLLKKGLLKKNFKKFFDACERDFATRQPDALYVAYHWPNEGDKRNWALDEIEKQNNWYNELLAVRDNII
jgi:hypothetical protein